MIYKPTALEEDNQLLTGKIGAILVARSFAEDSKIHVPPQQMQEIRQKLEEAISNFLGTEETILYSSCFDANGGLFETILCRPWPRTESISTSLGKKTWVTFGSWTSFRISRTVACKLVSREGIEPSTYGLRVALK